MALAGSGYEKSINSIKDIYIYCIKFKVISSYLNHFKSSSQH